LGVDYTTRNILIIQRVRAEFELIKSIVVVINVRLQFSAHVPQFDSHKRNFYFILNN